MEFEELPYDQDGLKSVHNHEFMVDPAFQQAYLRGINAVGEDYHWHWRVHVGLWAAFSANKLKGDFVECGVNKGFLSSAIMNYLNWDSLNKNFYLLDTFYGLDERYLSEADKLAGAMKKNQDQIEIGFYATNVERIRANFSEWKNIRIIEGPIPETLDQVDTNEVAFLHLDMNCSLPEIAAINFFWNRLVPGAFILLDDYAYIGYRTQKLAMDSFAQKMNLSIVSLPTGQGLMIKPV